MQIINTYFYNQFRDLCAESSESIKLCSPFVKKNIINDIFSLKKKSVDLSLITNVNLNSLYKGALDIEVLEALAERNLPIINAQRLHAKIYIFDNIKCVITSANLTSAGLKSNLEYGVFIDEKEIVNNVVADYQAICKNENNGIVEKKHILKIKEILLTLPNFHSEKLSKLEIDNSTEIENTIEIGSRNLINNFSGWKKLVLTLIVRLDKDIFTREDLKYYQEFLLQKYPKAKTPLQTLSRVLQELRDLGLIKFLGNGYYQKLWR